MGSNRKNPLVFTMLDQEKRGRTMVKRRGIDSLESWLMAVGSMLAFFVSMGFTRADGVMFVALMQEKGVSRELASWPFNLAGAAVVFVAPLTGILSTRFHPMHLALCGSFLFAAGYSACFASTNIIYLSICLGILKGSGQAIIITVIPTLINNSFENHRATAMGIATTGTPLGGFVLPLLVQYLLDVYGLSGTFLILGGIALHAVAGSCVYTFYPKSPNNITIPKDVSALNAQNKYVSEQTLPACENTKNQDCAISTYDEKSPLLEKQENMAYHRNNGNEEKNVSSNLNNNCDQKGKTSKYSVSLIKNVFSSRGFYLVAVSQVISLQLVEMFSLVVVDYTVDKGIIQTKAILLITITSGCEILGRLSFGWVTDKKYLRRPTYMMLCQTLSAVIVLLFSFSSKYYLLAVFSALLGMIQGSTLSVTHAIYPDYVRREEIALAVAFARSFHGLASVARSPIIGVFRDDLGSYDLLFLSISAVFFATGLMWFCECIYLFFKRRKNEEK